MPPPQRRYILGTISAPKTNDGGQEGRAAFPIAVRVKASARLVSSLVLRFVLERLG
jgi:hypothetical protein